MDMETQVSRDEIPDALVEGGSRKLPVAAGGVSNATVRRGDPCPGTEKLMEAVVERENMLSAYRRIKDHALNIAEVVAGEK